VCLADPCWFRKQRHTELSSINRRIKKSCLLSTTRIIALTLSCRLLTDGGAALQLLDPQTSLENVGVGVRNSSTLTENSEPLCSIYTFSFEHCERQSSRNREYGRAQTPISSNFPRDNPALNLSCNPRCRFAFRSPRSVYAIRSIQCNDTITLRRYSTFIFC